jgi:hypothetical protein
MSANRTTNHLGVQHLNGQRRDSQDSGPSLPAVTGLRWPFVADVPGPQGRKSLRLSMAGLRIRCFDPIAECSEFPDHSRCVPLLRLLGNGRATFFVTNSLVKDQPDQPTLSVGNGPDSLIVSQRGTERRYTISKMLPLVLAAALAVWLRTRRMWRLPSESDGCSSRQHSRRRRGKRLPRRRDTSLEGKVAAVGPDFGNGSVALSPHIDRAPPPAARPHPGAG